MNISNIKKSLFITVLCFFVTSVNANEKTTTEAYKFGVFPYLTPDHMRKIYSPVNQRLNSALQPESQFLTESSHRKFIHKLNNEIYDFALIPPFWYPVAVDKKNYKALLKMKEPFSALIVTLDDAPIYSVKDLKGKVVATPPVFAPVVNLAIAELVEQGMVPSIDLKLKAHETADACLRQVIDAKASACISPPYVPSFIEDQMKVKFRTIMTSSSIPSVSLVVHSRVDEATRYKIMSVFSTLSDTDQGRKILRTMQTEGFVPIHDDEYNVVRALLKKIKPMH